MKRHPFFLSLVLLLMPTHVCVAQRSTIYHDRIATLQVVAGEDWLSMPITQLGGNPIRISFDDMTHDYHRYTYKIEHCDADWTVSSELFARDYMQGFNGEQVIDDYDESLNTNHLYTHYRLTIPNKDCRLTMSGNYKLTVYDEDDDAQPMLTACFMVVEPQMKVSMSFTGNTDIDVNKGHQQVAAKLSYGSLHVSDPRRQLRTVVLQNGRWDNAVWDAKPDFIGMDGAQWLHCRQLVFPAGNVYRKFEMLDMSHVTMGLEDIKWDGEEYHAYVYPDTPRPSYVYDEAPQGAFYVRNSDNVDNDFLCDYAQVHFQLKAPRQDGEVYLNGNWTYDSFLPQYLMRYDEASQSYLASVLLKQGYYSYQYLVLREDDSTVPVTTEGSFFQTANKYQMLVYYRETGGRTDRLVGYALVK